MSRAIFIVVPVQDLSNTGSINMVVVCRREFSDQSGRDVVICRNTETGQQWIDRAATAGLEGIDRQSRANERDFCEVDISTPAGLSDPDAAAYRAKIKSDLQYVFRTGRVMPGSRLAAHLRLNTGDHDLVARSRFEGVQKDSLGGWLPYEVRDANDPAGVLRAAAEIYQDQLKIWDRFHKPSLGFVLTRATRGPKAGTASVVAVKRRLKGGPWAVCVAPGHHHENDPRSRLGFAIVRADAMAARLDRCRACVAKAV